MKVLQVLGSLGRAGAETMVMNYYNELNKKSCIFDFIVHANIINGYEKEVEKLGGKIYKLNRPGEIGIIKYIKQVRKVIRENGPYDVIHIHTNTQGFMPAIAAHKEGIPIIAVHSHSTKFPKHKVLINNIVGDYTKVKRLACGYEAGKALYGKNNFEVISNAISLDYFYYVNQEKIDELKRSINIQNKFIIGHVGRFVESKNHNFIIEVLFPIIKRSDDIILCLVGDGPLKKEIELKVKKLNIENQVIFMGVREDMNLIYKIFDVLILPSLKEGLPLTIIEAQASGKKCLCSDAVTNECDMGLGLVEYVSLNIDLWKDKIYEYYKHKQYDFPTFHDIKTKMKNYDIQVQSEKLLSIYEGKV